MINDLPVRTDVATAKATKRGHIIAETVDTLSDGSCYIRCRACGMSAWLPARVIGSRLPAIGEVLHRVCPDSGLPDNRLTDAEVAEFVRSEVRAALVAAGATDKGVLDA